MEIVKVGRIEGVRRVRFGLPRGYPYNRRRCFSDIQSPILIYLYGFSYKRSSFEPEQSRFVRFFEQMFAFKVSFELRCTIFQLTFLRKLMCANRSAIKFQSPISW